jgi:hypothetical protein
MFNGQSIANFLTENVLVVVVLVVAVGILTKANTGETRKAVTAVFIVLLGLFVVGASTHTNDIGGWLYRLVTGG